MKQGLNHMRSFIINSTITEYFYSRVSQREASEWILGGGRQVNNFFCFNGSCFSLMYIIEEYN